MYCVITSASISKHFAIFTQIIHNEKERPTESSRTSKGVKVAKENGPMGRNLMQNQALEGNHLLLPFGVKLKYKQDRGIDIVVDRTRRLTVGTHTMI